MCTAAVDHDTADEPTLPAASLQEMATFTWTKDQTKESVSVKDDASGRVFLRANMELQPVAGAKV
jgi:hypothetical protein